MKHFINIKDIPAKDLRSIIESSKKRKKKRSNRKKENFF
jgi:ornithine carbamoyltransferase